MAGPPGGIGQFAQRHVAQGTKFNQEHALTPLLSTAGGLARDRCSKVDPVRKQSIVPVSEKNSLLLLLILLLSAVTDISALLDFVSRILPSDLGWHKNYLRRVGCQKDEW